MTSPMLPAIALAVVVVAAPFDLGVAQECPPDTAEDELRCPGAWDKRTCTCAAGGRQSSQVVYSYPQMYGAVVDWCASWETACGQAGADQFCQTQGFARAASFEWQFLERTYVIGTRSICQGRCGGFSSVVCVR